MAELGSIVLDGAVIAELLRGPRGPVAQAVFDGATRVQDAAKVDVGKDTRDLERSIVKRLISGDGGDPGCLVGSDQPYALLHHEGTRPHDITPVRAKALRFRTTGGVRFAKRVRHPGTAPNPYLTKNLPLAVP